MAAILSLNVLIQDNNRISQGPMSLLKSLESTMRPQPRGPFY